MHILLVPPPAIGGDLASVIARLEAAGASVTTCLAADLALADLDSATVIAGPGSLRCDAALFDRAPRLRGIVSIGSGCEGFDTTEAGRRGIAVRRGDTRENVVGMASATILLMLALCHDLPGAQTAAQAGRRRAIDRARLLDGCVVGLVGYGGIAREVARRLALWNVDVRAFAPSRAPGSSAAGVAFMALDALLEACDVISLHAALNETSRDLIDARRIALMKPDALLVNTARGGLIDEAALADALTRGHIAGVALDCFAVEPLPVDSPLRHAPNLILTPHQIGHTADGARSVVDAFVNNILACAA